MSSAPARPYGSRAAALILLMLVTVISRFLIRLMRKEENAA